MSDIKPSPVSAPSPAESYDPFPKATRLTDRIRGKVPAARQVPEAIAEESDVFSPDFTGFQTMALASSLGALLQLGPGGWVEIANEPLECSPDSLKVLKSQIANNDIEIRNVIVDSYVWMAEMQTLELATMPYPDYLKTEHWKGMRERAIAEAEGKCQVCNSNKQLNVHHRTYENRGCEKLMDLTVLCAVCHQLFHDKGRLVK